MDVSLTKAIRVLLFLFLLVASLYYARPFLVPVVFASLLAMLLLPLCRRLQGMGMNKTLAIIICIVAFVAVMAGIIWLLYWQISDMAKDASTIEQTVNQKLSELKQYISHTFGISAQKQKAIIQDPDNSLTGKISAFASGVFSSMATFITNLLLVLIYVFLFMYYRTHLKKFVLQLIPAQQQQKALAVIDSCQKVAQEYLTGLALMIVCLWVMYGIGFWLVGIKSPIFFAILCGLLEIVPYVGNLTGSSLTALMTLAQGGSWSMAVEVLIVYSIVQFTQSYLIQPLVVGRQVNLNPVFSIGGIVVGDLIWGIPGMILIIPLLGIAKIVCDHIEPLKPFGFLMGEIKSKRSNKLTTKVKGWWGK